MKILENNLKYCINAFYGTFNVNFVSFNSSLLTDYKLLNSSVSRAKSV